MVKVAVDRSVGQLEVFKGNDFVCDELLVYVADRSPSLKCPLLEEILVFGAVVTLPDYLSKKPLLVLAELQQLRLLTLVAIFISKDELMAILDGCVHLELLDLKTCCFGFHVDNALLDKFSRIRTLELPDYYEHA
uniref:FBD domain-containing protein n=1 Tax=Leersia perrieri TaxID=77586 RepID=A0A0D9XUH4_9ORYZ